MSDVRNLTWHYVDYWAQRKPEAEFQCFGGERMTWGAFGDLTDRIAKALLELGVQRGDCVAMLSMSRNEFLPLFMAANKVGAMWLGLSPKFTAGELDYVLNDAQPKVLVTLRQFQGNDLFETALENVDACPFIQKILVIGDAPAGMDTFASCVESPRPEQDQALAARTAQCEPDDDALLLYTSGSTGKPKGVVLTHRSIVSNIEVECQYFPFDEDGVALLHFPINHVAATVEIGFAVVYSGGRVVHMEQFEPVATLEVVEREGVTLFGQVPVMYLMQLGTPKFQETDWSSVRAFVWSGAAAPNAVLHALSAIASKTGARLITGYGATEMAGFVTYTAPDDGPDTLAATVGRIAPPFKLRLVDDDGNEVPQGEVGEIAVKGPFLMDRYLNRPEATAEVLRDGWYYSSDLATMDERGYISLCGRKSEMFKTGGENVFPREVEETLEAHPAVLFAAVLGVPDETYAEVGHAFIALSPGQTVGEDDLRAHCKEHLANFKVPKRFDIRESLPLLANGKVDKRTLQTTLASKT